MVAVAEVDSQFWRDRRTLVTGASGFLGSCMTARLLAKGADVTVLIRDAVAGSTLFQPEVFERVNRVNGGLEDFGILNRAINEYEIDTVFHLAAQAIVSVANRHPVATFESNIMGTWNLLEACRQLDSVSRIVVASSDKAYGSHDKLPYDETFALQGAHPYDVSKSCADLIALAYHNTYGLPVSVTRCGNLYGAGDLNFSRIVPGTIRSALLGERPIIRSDGSPKRDYVHVRDAADAYLILAQQMDRPEIVGEAFNFGPGEPLTVLEITNKILDAVGEPGLEPVVLNEAAGEIRDQYLSSAKATRLLGWRSSMSIEEGLADTVPWYRHFLIETEGDS